MPTAYIHAGDPKTGTSSFQEFLVQHDDWLAERGLYVPKTGRSPKGAHHMLVRELTGIGKHAREFGMREEALRELRAHNDGDIILSSESLSTMLLVPQLRSRILGAVRSCGFDITIVVYVAERLAVTNSLYAQAAKTLSFSGGFVDFVMSRHSLYLLPPWRTYMPMQGVELILKPFNAHVRKTGITADLLAAIGISDTPPPGGKRANISPGPVTVGLIRTMGRELASQGQTMNNAQKFRFTSAVEAIVNRHGLAGGRYCGLTAETMAIVENDTRAEVEHMAQRIWGTSWDEQFPETADQQFICNDVEMTDLARPPVKVWREMMREAADAWETIEANNQLRGYRAERPFLHVMVEAGIPIERIKHDYFDRLPTS